MVRLKHRYLLVNILYPPTASNTLPVAKPLVQGKDTTEFAETEFHLQVCRPTPDYFKAQLLARMIRDTVSDTFGDWGMGKLGGAGAGRVSVKYLSPATSTAIIRCPRESYRLVWAALTYMSRLPGNKDGNQSGSGKRDPPIECVFRVVRVSGTMKKAEQEAIRRARLEVAKVSNYWEAQGKDILQEMFPGSTMAIGIESEGGDEEDDGSDT